MPVKLSYINMRGEEAILDDDEGTFAHELQGREGFEFPSIDLAEHEYGDGSSDIVAVTVKNREVTCYFWADMMDIPHWEEKFDEVKEILLQTGQKEDEWGKLKIRLYGSKDAQDGKVAQYVYLNCVYSKGLDSIVRDNQNRIKFYLTFKATDPYFYNGFDYTVTSRQDDREGYLMFETATICNTQAQAQQLAENDPNLYFRITGTDKYYGISKAESLYMNEGKIFNTQTEAIGATGETTEGNNWWHFDYGGVTKYYAIIKSNTLYMQSANASTLDSLFIQAAKVYPKIVINGPAENIILTNHTTGRKIQLDPSVKLDNNQKIYINTTPLKRSITRNSWTGTNLIPYLSIDSTLDWWLDHGNNDIELHNTTTTPVSYMEFTYTERRLSIL